jgi:hypothetical protein
MLQPLAFNVGVGDGLSASLGRSTVFASQWIDYIPSCLLAVHNMSKLLDLAKEMKANNVASSGRYWVSFCHFC